MKHKINTIFLATVLTLMPMLSANAAINKLNNQNGATQTFANDANIIINSANNVHGLGWNGLLSIVRGGTNNSSFTGGSVIYFDGTKFSQNNANLFWNNSNLRLGIGTSAPSYRLDVQGGQINASGGLCIAGDCRTSWPTLGIQSLNGLSATSQTFVNDSNVTIASAGSSHTLGWSGLLPIYRGGTNNSLFTTGSIPFFDGTKLNENNTQLFWDNTNNRLGVGTNTPSSTVDVQGIVTSTQVTTNTLSAIGTNQSLSLNPTGTGKVMVGGDSLVVTSKSSTPNSPIAGQIYFDSVLGQFRGYNGTSWVALSVANNALLSNGLASYWKLNESNGNAVDSVGPNTLTNNNGVTYSSGKINNGANFVRTSTQSLSITDGSQTGLNITGDISVSFWIKISGIPANGQQYYIAAKAGPGSNTQGYNFDYIRDDTDFPAGSHTAIAVNYWKDNLRTYIAAPYDLGTGVWHHVVIATTVASETASIYVDGVSQSTSVLANSTNSIGASTESFILGTDLDGSLDEIGIWDRVLTSDEVSQLYNNGNGITLP
jgi:hypothetical protein